MLNQLPGSPGSMFSRPEGNVKSGFCFTLDNEERYCGGEKLIRSSIMQFSFRLLLSIALLLGLSTAASAQLGLKKPGVKSIKVSAPDLTGTWHGEVLGEKKGVTFYMSKDHYVFVDPDSVVLGTVDYKGKSKDGNLKLDFLLRQILAHGGKTMTPKRFKLPAVSLAAVRLGKGGNQILLCSAPPGSKARRPVITGKGAAGARCINMTRVGQR